jgi:cytochrome c-type biogenesis protein CcmH/NrfG
MLEISRFLPDRANVWVDLGSMYARMNRRADALSALARAVELNPGGRAQLAQNERLAALRSDPEFLRIVGGP